MSARISTLIVDIDNTLFDWLTVWHSAFSAMLSSIARESGVSREQLAAEFRVIHQRHGTVEYAFSIDELPSLQRLHPEGKPSSIYAASIDAFRFERRRHLRLYPTVTTTLEAIRSRGCTVAAYTESFAFYSAYRIKRLGLDWLLDFVYSPPDHDLPKNVRVEEIRSYPPESYQLEHAVHRHTPRGAVKPNPEILLDIIENIGARPETTAYVGDSLLKDVLMAQRARVADVWARYGNAPGRPEYELLREVTHWTDADVKRERELSSVEVKPTYVLDTAFGELLSIFTFDPVRGGKDSFRTAT